MNTPTEDKARALELSSLGSERLETLTRALEETRALEGEVWECGSYKGGSALHLAAHCRELGLERSVRLFDTFAGMPHQGEHDIHKVGSFGDTSFESVWTLFGDYPNVVIEQGVIPATFKGLEDARIAVAHIDVDQYQSVLDSLAFIFPRMPIGGWIILDDYNCGSCPGAKIATTEFCNVHIQAIRGEGRGPQVYIVKQ